MVRAEHEALDVFSHRKVSTTQELKYSSRLVSGSQDSNVTILQENLLNTFLNLFKSRSTRLLAFEENETHCIILQHFKIHLLR